MLDWLIIGGGIHGTHLSHVLTTRLGVSPGKLRVLDPHPDPLAHWNQYTANTGMRHLRSSSVHHIDILPHSLRRFAVDRPGHKLRDFKYPYHRPGVELFARHCRDVISRHRLAELRLPGRATGLDTGEGCLRVETDQGTIAARRVLLAIGMGEQPRWPRWSEALRESGCSVDHLYRPGFLLDDIPDWDRLLVVGGGIGAAQAAIKLASRLPGAVSLLRRHGARIHQFDSDPGWNGPRRLKPFHGEPDFRRRREIINGARFAGSVPPDVQVEFDWYVRSGKIELIVGEVDTAVPAGDGGAEFRIDGVRREFDRLVLACGFERKRPGGAWLDAAVTELGLPVNDCGYPLVDRFLRWHERIFVCGPLAELELGPIARNIPGARHAGHRLFEFLG